MSGPSRREDRLLAIPVVLAIVGFYTSLGALEHDGYSRAAVYGVVAAAQEDWWKLAGGLAMVVVGAGVAFAGPIGVWGIRAVAGCLLLSSRESCA